MSARADQPAWTYVLWGAVGVLIGFGVVGILTIGIFLLGLAFILAIVGVAFPASRSAAALAVLPGLGVLPLVVGLNNLGGPGERCSSTQSSLSCIELLSPWPFLLPGIVLIVIGGWVAWRFGRTPAT
jgi:hypothetical protein